jgi:CBS domain-containing protein
VALCRCWDRATAFGERGLLRDGLAVTTARATEDAVILRLPTAEFRGLIAECSRL